MEERDGEEVQMEEVKGNDGEVLEPGEWALLSSRLSSPCQAPIHL